MQTANRGMLTDEFGLGLADEGIGTLIMVDSKVGSAQRNERDVLRSSNLVNYLVGANKRPNTRMPKFGKPPSQTIE